jgi:hypothetical protein
MIQHKDIIIYISLQENSMIIGQMPDQQHERLGIQPLQ